MLKACSSSSLRSDRSPTGSAGSRPELAVANSVEQALVHRSGTAIPCCFVVVERFRPASAGDGGAGGIRTLDTAFQPYNGLANRRLQPLGHSTTPNFSLRDEAEGIYVLPASLALSGRGSHSAHPEGRPFALERRLAQGGLLGSKWRIPAAFCSRAPETAAARQR